MYRMILAVAAFAFVAACDSGMPKQDEAVAQGKSGEVEKVTIVEVASDGTKKGAVTVDKVVRTKEEWKTQLTDEQYYVTREKGTERAFTGIYNKHDEDGVYKCIGCGTPLFSVPGPSMNRERAGPVSTSRSPKRTSTRSRTSATA